MSRESSNGNFLSKLVHFQNLHEKHKENQNVLNGQLPPAVKKNLNQLLSNTEYGHPIEGSPSFKRAEKARQRVDIELEELYRIIAKEGRLNEKRGIYVISFGQLFSIYERISNKLNGLLVTARKRCVVDFKGELLFERKDDDVLIEMKAENASTFLKG